MGVTEPLLNDEEEEEHLIMALHPERRRNQRGRQGSLDLGAIDESADASFITGTTTTISNSSSDEDSVNESTPLSFWRRKRILRRSLATPAHGRERMFNRNASIESLESTILSRNSSKSILDYNSADGGDDDEDDEDNVDYYNMIDPIIDLIVPFDNTGGANIIRHYKPQPTWLWKQWSGTVFEHGVPTALSFMAYALVVCLILPYIDNPDVPNQGLDFALIAMNSIWQYLLTLTTFIMTFFLNQSYQMWRQVYNLSRSLQGRTNDFGFLAATHAARDPHTGTYTPAARQLLEDVALACRAIHIFCYASRTRRYRILHTKPALERMVERGVLKQELLDALQLCDVAPTARADALLSWIVVRLRAAVQDGALQGGAGLEQAILDKAMELRGHQGGFGGILDARMPLAYVHFLQVMVDTLLICSPLALYKTQKMYSVFTVGVTTVFFSGLYDLCKVMLDPFDNEDYCDGVMDMNLFVFIREANNGSVRFMKGAEHLPPGWLNNTVNYNEEGKVDNNKNKVKVQGPSPTTVATNNWLD